MAAEYIDSKQNDIEHEAVDTESLLEHASRVLPARRTAWKWRTVLPLALSLVAAVLVGFVFYPILMPQRHKCFVGLSEAQSKFFPEFPNKQVHFTNGGVFNNSGIAGDQAWDSLVPLGAGYVRIPHPRQYDLRPSVVIANDTEEAEVYQVSFIHQVHCLGYLRAYVLHHEEGKVPQEHGKNLTFSNSHMTHCIDYVRQAVLCNADITLEGASEDGTFSGRNSIHQCRDPDAINEFLIERRANDFVRSILHT